PWPGVTLVTMESPSKKRRYARAGARRGMYVAWQGIGERFVSPIETVGLGGLFIRVRNPPPVGDVIRLYFEIPVGEIRAQAITRGSTYGEGTGIAFPPRGPEARGRLTRLLRKLLGEDAPDEKPQPLQS